MSHDQQLVQPLQRDATSAMSPNPHRKGVRTHVLLVLAMGLVTIIVTSIFLGLLRHRLHAQMIDDLSADLTHSVITFEDLQAERLTALDRENALLAALPTLKALMTSGDERTIQDGAVEFWQLSGNDLFALADASGKIVAVYSKNGTPDASLRAALTSLLESPGKHYLINGNYLYSCSQHPLYFGNDVDGTLLGYIVSGSSIERTVRQISGPTDVEATFLSDGRVVASTLGSAHQSGFANPLLLAATPRAPATVKIGGAPYLAATETLSTLATSQLQLVLLKSFGPTEDWISRIDRMVLSTGVLSFLAGTVLMLALARWLTRPLEELSDSVRAFGMGDSRYRIPAQGTVEVRQLSAAFAAMRNEIQQKSSALLEAERLATIGRMASSVSHDLRHYLAAVYANSEFLASSRLSEEERAEIFADIRAAVHGTTDMIESLLVFSRTGGSIRRSPEVMPILIDQAVAIIRAHPDAEGVRLVVDSEDTARPTANVDGKQIVRAVSNLLLNACQAARLTSGEPRVAIKLYMQEQDVFIRVIDNGPGVSLSIRNSLFDPFVSEGKQKGTGLGLTLVACIAEEHGGDVVLVSSQPGETVFQMRLSKNLLPTDISAEAELQSSVEVIAHENASR